MAEKLKHFFDESVVRSIASDLRRAHSSFRQRAFASACSSKLARLELTARAWHVADVMYDYLPRPFVAAADILVNSLGPPLTRSDEFGLAPLRYMPHVFFVQKYGLDDFDAAMRAQYDLTQRFSAESSIRAFLVRYPEKTYARLLQWARDENVHVRRLVSEGARPRLPWAPRLRAFQNVCRRWLTGASSGREWIVRHALRSLVKSAHSGALETLGFGGKPDVGVTLVQLVPKSVKLGGELRFSFEIASTGAKVQELLVDYAVHFVKANGGTRPKMFKLRKIVLAPSQRLELADTISFESMTTRRHYPGRHRIDVMINGVAYPLAEFAVRR